MDRYKHGISRDVPPKLGAQNLMISDDIGEDRPDKLTSFCFVNSHTMGQNVGSVIIYVACGPPVLHEHGIPTMGIHSIEFPMNGLMINPHTGKPSNKVEHGFFVWRGVMSCEEKPCSFWGLVQPMDCPEAKIGKVNTLQKIRWT